MTVVQALAKGDRGELAVELLTEVGVDAIVPWAAANCVTQWRDERAERSRQKWVDAAVSAAKQSRRARFPDVAELATSKQVAGLLQAADVGLVLHETATLAIGDVPCALAASVIVVVGPEGGISPEELEAFEAAGASVVRLGPSVLRTSSAGLAAVAALLSGSERWAVPSRAGLASDAGVEG
jgi:16S rRNA (uracil1498-N3)-methyltransferase